MDLKRENAKLNHSESKETLQLQMSKKTHLSMPPRRASGRAPYQAKSSNFQFIDRNDGQLVERPPAPDDPTTSNGVSLAKDGFVAFGRLTQKVGMFRNALRSEMIITNKKIQRAAQQKVRELIAPVQEENIYAHDAEFHPETSRKRRLVTNQEECDHRNRTESGNEDDEQVRQHHSSKKHLNIDATERDGKQGNRKGNERNRHAYKPSDIPAGEKRAYLPNRGRERRRADVSEDAGNVPYLDNIFSGCESEPIDSDAERYQRFRRPRTPPLFRELNKGANVVENNRVRTTGNNITDGSDEPATVSDETTQTSLETLGPTQPPDNIRASSHGCMPSSSTSSEERHSRHKTPYPGPYLAKRILRGFPRVPLNDLKDNRYKIELRRLLLANVHDLRETDQKGSKFSLTSLTNLTARIRFDEIPRGDLDENNNDNIFPSSQNGNEIDEDESVITERRFNETIAALKNSEAKYQVGGDVDEDETVLVEQQDSQERDFEEAFLGHFAEFVRGDRDCTKGSTAASTEKDHSLDVLSLSSIRREGRTSKNTAPSHSLFFPDSAAYQRKSTLPDTSVTYHPVSSMDTVDQDGISSSLLRVAQKSSGSKSKALKPRGSVPATNRQSPTDIWASAFRQRSSSPFFVRPDTPIEEASPLNPIMSPKPNLENPVQSRVSQMSEMLPSNGSSPNDPLEFFSSQAVVDLDKTNGFFSFANIDRKSPTVDEILQMPPSNPEPYYQFEL